MAITTTFTVKNNVSVDTCNHVLVFLKPVKASSNYQYIAWQDLNPPRNGSQPFSYVIDLGVSVFDASKAPPPLSTIYPINPGQLFAATDLNTQGPTINPINIPSGQVTSAQVGVLNACSSTPIPLGINWTNGGNLIVQVGAAANDIVNVGKVVTLELEPTLYFMAADPTSQGPNYTLQDFSAMTPFTLTAGVTEVAVSWSRANNGIGVDLFTFSPPSHS